MLETFNRAQLNRLVKYYYLHTLIPYYRGLSKESLIQQLKNFVRVDNEYFVHFVPRKTDIMMNGKLTKEKVIVRENKAQQKITKPKKMKGKGEDGGLEGYF